MAPFAKFRGHRRTSTPTSPNASANHVTDSPRQQYGAPNGVNFSGGSPYEQSLPSPALHSPAFSGPTTFSPRGQSSHDLTALPRFPEEDYHIQQKHAYFDQPRPASSSAAVGATFSSPVPASSFQGPQRLKAFIPQEQGSQYAALPMTDRAFSHDGGVVARAGGLSASSSERTLAEDYEGQRVATSKGGKGRLNLLNPMTLLARRRSSQAVSQIKEEGPININTLPVPAMPEDYDPRIRGNIIHDFSAPRPRRNLSADVTPSFTNQSRLHSYNEQAAEHRRNQTISSPGQQRERVDNPSPEHTPHFKEDFSDDVPNLQPASTRYLHAFAATSAIPHPDHGPPAVPAFARGLPTRIPDSEEPSKKGVPALPRTEPPQPPPTDTLPASLPVQPRPPSSEPYSQASALPKHMSSNASRFSFDFNGIGSATQEKLLEERHKQKAAAHDAGFDFGDDDASELDDYANYGFDDFDDFEEKIPGVNVDADDMEDEGPATVGSGLQQFRFTPTLPSAIMSPASQYSDQHSFPTPRDDQGQAIGFAMTKESPSLKNLAPHYQYADEDVPGPSHDAVQGLGISSMLDESNNDDKSPNSSPRDFEEDDLYFDDGNIDLGAEDSEQHDFDESIFDDETGKLRDIPAQNSRNLDAAHERQLQGSPPTDKSSISRRSSIEGGRDGTKTELWTGPQNNTSEKSGLTESNMAAFQKALMSIADEATAKDRVIGKGDAGSISDGQKSASRNEESHPGLVSDDSHHSQAIEPLEATQISEGYDFEQDDMDDDLLIAEANAEALENDDDGFYGREFGFYARAHPKTGTEMVNGGYFIPKGMEGINRSHSGRANFQEPSLTPITERSEWSARNSMASVSAFGLPQSAHSLPSPALADLLGQVNLEDDMSLSTLLRLRRGAWGGSQTSLHSSAASQTSNPPQNFTSPRENIVMSPDAPVHMSSSVHSLSGSLGIPESEEEDEDEVVVSPTVTQNTPRKASQTTQTTAPFTPVAAPSFAQRAERPRPHSRTSSGADSVSYSRDQDGRFIIERKRTLDSGEIELIGREILVGNI